MCYCDPNIRTPCCGKDSCHQAFAKAEPLILRCPWHPTAPLPDRHPSQANRIEAALEIANQYGGTDEAHHKAWVIDQMVRALAWARYEKWVRDHKDGEDGPETYGWDEGIAP